MRVSIIIPTYNRADYLLEALDSILGQSHDDVEVIIVDDQSTDDTEAKLGTYISSLPPEKAGRITFLIQEKAGAPAARNLGFRTSTGEGIVFMDSDDLLTAEGLAAGVARLEQGGCDYVYLPVQKCDENSVPLPGEIVGAAFGTGLSAEIAGYHWQTMGAIYKRDAAEKVGPWNPELTGSQDWEYQARVKMSGAKGAFVDVIIGYWRTHDKGRIGTLHYNSKYVASVEKACLAIATEAKERHLFDAALRTRLVRRLVIHAIEAGASSESTDRTRLLKSAADLVPGGSGTLLRLATLVKVPALDRFALSLSRR